VGGKREGLQLLEVPLRRAVGSTTRHAPPPGRDIKRGQVWSSDLRHNNVKSRDIKDGTLQEEDLADGVLTGAYWAVVTADAQLDRGKGVGNVARLNEINAGAYVVEFDKPIADCA
jgi:hypothetical protein